MAIIVSRATAATFSGNGTITAATNSTTVNGTSTLFTSEVSYAGKALFTSADVYIGTVSSITNNTTIVLTANAAVAVTSGAYKIGYQPKGTPLTNTEIDTNFININNNKLETSDAVTSSTANTVVKRDSSSNFSANIITASLNGNANTATTASTANALNTSNNYQGNSLGVGTAPSTTAGEIRATNAITSYYSDERLKDNITPIENALDKIEELTGVLYTQNKIAEQYGYVDYSTQVGVLAGQVNKVLPQAVKPAPFDIERLEDGTEVSKSGENYLTVQYERLVPLLIEGIKELRQEIKDLKGIK
jgi:hypothetical protein